jgi:hypothetical protein
MEMNQAVRVPLVTHWVEYPSTRSRVYRAICGESVHSGEVKTRVSATPSCQTCSRLLAEFDADDSEF